MITVSILIPVYNVSRFIVRCLQSVELQTYTMGGGIECIIIDDCGSDGSIALAKGFIDNYKGNINFRILHHEHNRGLAAARNTALANAKGDFVFHLDGDDWLEPTAIQKLVMLYEKTGADIVSGNALKHEDSGVILMKEPNYDSPISMVHKTIEMTMDHVIWRRLIRRTLYTDNNITAREGVNIGEDHHTLPRLAYYSSRIVTLDEVVYHYNCQNPTSYMALKTKKFNLTRYKSDLASLNILKNFFQDKDEYCRKRLKHIERFYIFNSLRHACNLNDRSSYKEICRTGNISLAFPIFRILTMAINLRKRL